MNAQKTQDQADVKTKIYPVVLPFSIGLFVLSLFTLGMPGFAWMYIVVKPMEAFGLTLRALESDGIWAGIIHISLQGPILMSLSAWIIDKYVKNDGKRPWLKWLVLTYSLHFLASYFVLR